MSEERDDRRAVQLGLANNAFGAAAGTVATVQARQAWKRAAKKGTLPAGRVGRFLSRTRISPTKAIAIAGGTNVAGQALNGLLDAQSAHYFAREATRKPEHVTTEKGLAMTKFEGQPSGRGRRIVEPTRAEIAKRVSDERDASNAQLIGRYGSAAAFPVIHGAIAGRPGHKMQAAAYETPGLVLPTAGALGAAVAADKGHLKPLGRKRKPKPEVAKRAYGQASSSGSKGVMDDASYDRVADRTVTRQTVRAAGAGAALGGVAGLVIRGPKGALIGGGLGSGAGALEGNLEARRVMRRPKSRAMVEEAVVRNTARQLGGQVNEAKWGVENGTRLVHERKSAVAEGGNVEKVFDPEADRQRRTGVYAGLLGGGAIVAGDHARREITTDVGPGKTGVALKKRPVSAKRTPPGKTPRLTSRKGALLAAGTGALALGSVGTYKHGLSRRNEPWT